MDNIIKKIEEIEEQIEKTLWGQEMQDDIKKAMENYKEAEAKLDTLGLTIEDPAYAEQQRVLSYCLLRQGNILRQMGKADEAFALSEREITAAHASNNDITLARSLLSNGTNHLIAGGTEKGLKLIEKARDLFEVGESYDHKQGFGWYWILLADLTNAGLIEKEPSEVIEFASRAIEILKPIENWPGVARAFGARAKAYEKIDKTDDAERDQKEQKHYESLIEEEDNNASAK